MSLTIQHVLRIADLARLKFNLTESTNLLCELNELIKIIDKVSSVRTSELVALSHPIDVYLQQVLRLRDDINNEPNQRCENQLSAPSIKKQFYIVPKLIE